VLIIAAIAFAALTFVKIAVASEERTRLTCCLLVVLAWHGVWLPIVQLELDAARGKSTYGSDADYYAEEMAKTCASRAPIETAKGANSYGFVLFGAAVLTTSPGHSIIWVKLANISALILCLCLIYWLMRNNDIKPTYCRFFVLLLGLNGIVTWMVLRNLKDTLFVTGAFVQITLLFYLLCRSRRFLWTRLLLSLLITALSGYLLTTIRPWGTFFSLTVMVSVLLTALSQEYVRWIHVCVLLVASVLALFAAQDWLVASTTRYMRGREKNIERGGLPMTGPPVARVVAPPVRFLTGPGFVRAMAGHDAFVVTTSVGNVLVGLGALMWWALLPLWIMGWARPPSYLLRDAAIIIPALSLLLVYSYLYGGTVDTRTRAVFYLLSTPWIARYAEELSGRSFVVQGNRRIIYLSLVMATFVLGVAYSYRTVF
jgi:hypothetical protein